MDEALLIRRLQAGEASAWNEVVAAFGARLRRAAVRFCRDEHHAGDAVQETLLRFAGSLPRFRGECALYTWLYGILRNTVRQQRRASQRLVFTDTPPDLAYEEPPPVASDAEAVARTLQAALARLSDDHRTVILLRYYEQRTVAEIAAQLGVSAGTVKSRLFHARRQLSVLLPESLNPFAT